MLKKESFIYEKIKTFKLGYLIKPLYIYYEEINLYIYLNFLLPFTIEVNIFNSFLIKLFIYLL